MQSNSCEREGNQFIRFMASGYGRLVRVGAGSAIIVIGLAAIPWPAGLAVAALGLAPVLTGAVNYCPVTSRG